MLKSEKIIAFKVDPEIKKEAWGLADEKGISLSSYCRMILFEQLKAERKLAKNKQLNEVNDGEGK